MTTEQTINNKSVPNALKNWFIVHFIADITFAIPMFLIPVTFLNLLGWKIVDPITTRMVASALFGIGIESLLSRNSSLDSFKTMLTLKIIWSFCALVGLGLGLIQGLFIYKFIGISIFLIFFIFNILWSYWLVRVNRIIKSG